MDNKTDYDIKYTTLTIDNGNVGTMVRKISEDDGDDVFGIILKKCSNGYLVLFGSGYASLLNPKKEPALIIAVTEATKGTNDEKDFGGDFDPKRE